MGIYKPKYDRYDKVLKSAKRRVPLLPSMYYEAIPKEARRYAFTVSSIERISVIEDVLTSLNKSFEAGETFLKWRDSVNIENFNKLSESRKELVFKMHSQSMYNSGVHFTGVSQKENYPWFKFQSTNDDRTRPNHQANDGITRPVDDPFWETNTPPLGFGCRCIKLAISVEEAEEEKLTSDEKINSINVRPDADFDYNKLKPIPALDKYQKQKIKEMPASLQKSFNEYNDTREADSFNWWQKNKNLFNPKG